MKTIFTILLIAQISLFAQSEFNIDNYKEYLNSHQDMSYPDLLNEYPASKFNAYSKTNFYDAKYSDSINQFFGLTPDEILLLNSHSFMVSERLSYPSFIEGLYELYKKDIPVYLSADMMLHSVHKSVDNILIDIEKNLLSDKLSQALTSMLKELESYDRNKYASDQVNHVKYSQLIDDANLYLMVALNTLKEKEVYNPSESIKEKYAEITTKIKSAEGMDKIQLFADISYRRYDWSQFKPRGHYADKYVYLESYFKTLIWLGRTEIYIAAPKSQETDSLYILRKSEIMRQNRLAYFITYLAKKTDATSTFKLIDETIATFIGRQDNITNFELEEVIEGKVNSADDLLDNGLIKELQSKALELNSAQQTYLSQILTSDSMIKEEIEPAVAFMLMGQRPIFDGFITSKVTFDRVVHKGDKIMRMLPNSLDVLFGLGNNASIQALEKELIHYSYSSNLAALRYLINSYDDDFWSKNVYTSWLSSIRGLNPKNTREERDQLPEFMRTAAWWQKSMNTQLASWAELRHDFLLYAKQPYTASIYGCCTPDAFLEPVPEMYASILNIYKNIDKLDNVKTKLSNLNSFLRDAISTFESLVRISKNTLNNSLTNEDQLFLNDFLSKQDKVGCAEQNLLDGWYTNLFYNVKIEVETLNRKNGRSFYMDFLVADIHTSPTDADGNPVGWVKHIATGPINMAVIVTNNKDGEKTAYAGPVSSFYEFTTRDYERYTDSQWQDEFFGVDPQIDMVNLKFGQNSFTKHYLADYDGKAFNYAPELLVTSVGNDDYNYNNEGVTIYPNPASNYINLLCSVTPGELKANFKLINMDGIVVQSKEIKFVATGNNIMHIPLNESLKSGTYIYSLDFDKTKYSGKVSVVK